MLSRLADGHEFFWGNASALKEAVADLTLENRLLKKSMLGDGDDDI